MKPLSYMRAMSVETAVATASDKNRLLSGGIDLLGELKEGLADAELLVSITRIPGLGTIEQTSSGAWRIGANVTIAEIAAHPRLREIFPALVEAAEHVASPQIRNVSTIAGNLAQHSRCWYYRHRDVVCLRKGGDTCFAQEGNNKYHSLFTGSGCLSPCVSNLSVALAALDATILVQNKKAATEPARVKVAQFYAPAWEDPRVHNALAPDDMIVGVEIPMPRAPARAGSTFLQQSEKASFDWALVSCAVALELDGRVVRSARIVLGAVAPIPYRDERAEAALVGNTLDESAATRAADILLERADPLPHNGYKVPLARALIKRALLKLVA